MNLEPTSGPTRCLFPPDGGNPTSSATTAEPTDLPALESVAVGSRVPIVSGAILASFFSLPAVGFIQYWHQVSEQGFAIGSLVALYMLAVIWLCFRILTLDVSAQADAQGLEVRSLVRRRFVPWSDVQGVKTHQSCLAGGLVYRLQTTRGALWLPEHLPDGRTHSSEQLIAAVWQHLRRVRRADGMVLSARVASVWTEITDALPTSGSLTPLPAGPSPVPVWIILTALFLLSSVLAIWLWKDGASDALPIFAASSSPCALMAVGLICCDRWAKRVVARSVLLAPEGIVAKTERRLVVLPWTEITRVRWLCSGHPWMSLLLGASDHAREIVIYCRAEDDPTGLFLLALIHRLRAHASPPAVALPLPLRNQLGSLRTFPPPPAAERAPAILARPSGIET
jgi:hypothetical protein